MYSRLFRASIALALFGSTPILAQVEAAKPWLGVAIDDGKLGVLVTNVLPDTPAASAGLAKDDQITAIEKVTVKNPKELITAVQKMGVGNEVEVHFVREGKPMSKIVKLVARPDQLELLRKKVVGKTVTPFEVKVIAGPDSGKSEALKGKVVILEFWATWCPACLSTHKRLSEIAASRRQDGLVVLAISDEDEATIKGYVAQKSWNFTVAQDTNQAMRKEWSVGAIPLIAVIDRSGTVTYATIGGGSYLEEAISTAEKHFSAK